VERGAKQPLSPFLSVNCLLRLKIHSTLHIQEALAEQSKGYDIEFVNHGEYLHAIVGGLRVTSEVALGYWHEVVDECELRECSNILHEHNFVEMISKEEMLEVIGPLAHLLEGRIFAFYDHYGHYEIPEAGKAILRSLNVKMQIFHNLPDAQRWLTAN